MRKRWVVMGWALAILAGGCRDKTTSAPAPSSSTLASAPVVQAGASSAPTPHADDCSAPLDYLVEPAKYGDADLFRAIVADSTHVYFRNMRQVFRVPLAGGKAEVISDAPGLTLSGKTVLFESGDRLLTQSSNEPIFMASPKSGGPWQDIINLSPKKVGGGRDAATRLLQGLGSAPVPRSSQAAFDGSAFYWADNTMSRGLNVSSSATLRSVPLSGGEAKELFKAQGEIGEVHRAGSRVVFVHTAPLTPQQIKSETERRKSKKLTGGERGEQRLMSVPVAGGEAKELAKISSFIANLVLGTDGTDVYVSGYPNGDFNKPGVYRLNAEGGALEAVDQRSVHGQAFSVGNRVIIVGSSQLEPGPGNVRRGQVVLALDRGAKSATRIACIADGYTAHAFAVAGDHLLISLFKGDTNLASIARIALH
ncbi:MAG TPA: hypothetical protein VFQ35_06155 [Polyangiaceae bacterium]|nr:hypothetical protein [Polyangiaceae bacterium]